jgi:signal transduction histidine kinase/DNA-binding response OmpR family regulator
VSELQRYILVFSHTENGSNIGQLENRQQALVAHVVDLLADYSHKDTANYQLLLQMQSGIHKFKERIETLLIEREYRDSLVYTKLEGLYRDVDVSMNAVFALIDSSLQSSQKQPLQAKLWQVKLKISQSQVQGAKYFSAHDFAMLKDTVRRIDEADSLLTSALSIKNAPSITTALSDLKQTVGLVKQTFRQAVQADRNYLFLVNVVIAGESAELSIVADKLKEGFVEEQGRLFTTTEQGIDFNQRVILYSSIVGGVIALLIALLIGRRISRPIQSITETFDRLVKGDSVSEIPGAMSNDEIGRLAQAANVFRENNARTQGLLEQSERYSLELKEREKALEQAVFRAQEAAVAKGQFLASMSHEIRTPMNGVIGMLNLLRKELLSDQQRHYIALAQSSAESLLSLINDILDFSKIEAGKLDIEKIDFDIHDLFTDVSATMAPQVQDQGLEFVVDIQGLGRHMVKGDPGRIRQVLTNLLANALKFTEQGRLRIEARLENDQQGDDYCLYCDITDTGIGIPADKLTHLFDSFTQADSSTTRQFGGTGLGLAIVRQLCRLMGGGVDVSSEVGVGSCFGFYIPLGRSEASEQHPRLLRSDSDKTNEAVAEDFSGKRLLLVEDNAINQQVVLGLLGDMGLSADVAGNGMEALQAMKHGSDAACYDLILMDCQMPEMDGYTASRKIRQGELGEHYRDIPIVALTANAMLGDRENCFAAGMSDYLAKPIDEGLLLGCLKKWLLDIVDKELPESAQALAKGVSSERESSEKALTDHQVLVDWDRTAALARVRNREERLAILVKMFLDGMPAHIEQLEQALENKDPETAAKTAHSIKGVAANLSALRLQTAASEMELLGRAGDGDAMRLLLPELLACYRSVCELFSDAL